MRQVVLCDTNGIPTGTMEITAAHQGEGALHQAISAFVFRNNGNELLIQQRSALKPLFGGLWANTVCTHPLAGEDPIQTGQRRLKEELGISCSLQAVGSFVYQAPDPRGNGSEHEYDVVLEGSVGTDVEVHADPNEIEATRWITLEELQKELDTEPEKFAPWFTMALSKIFDANK